MQASDFVHAIHQSPVKVVMAITGGGTRAISQLASVAGASSTLLEAHVPYSESSLTDLLGCEPEQACSEQVARQMAMACFQRARELDPIERPQNLIGIGATAALATTRPKKGEHRIYVAAQTSHQTYCLTLEFEKGLRDRDTEESVASHAILALLSHVADIQPMDLTLTPDGIHASLAESEADEACIDMLSGEREFVSFSDEESSDSDLPKLIFPGSFNPPHEAHWKMAAIASKEIGKPVCFEISLTNVDKPMLDYLEISRRLQMLPEENVLLTMAPTFIEKARLFPDCLFIVGADTLARIADVDYYAGGFQERDAAIAELQHLGCRFLAFGRVVDGEFQEADELPLPSTLKELTHSVPENVFRLDLSSTELRQTERNLQAAEPITQEVESI